MKEHRTKPLVLGRSSQRAYQEVLQRWNQGNGWFPRCSCGRESVQTGPFSAGACQRFNFLLFLQILAVILFASFFLSQLGFPGRGRAEPRFRCWTAQLPLPPAQAFVAELLPSDYFLWDNTRYFVFSIRELRVN